MKISSFAMAIIFGLTVFIILPILFVALFDSHRFAFFDTRAWILLGFVLCVLGLGIFFYCSGLFVLIGKGTPVPIEPPKELVVKGLYSYSRNPMYIAYLLIIWGQAMVFSYTGLYMYAILAVICFDMYVKYIEEPGLKKRFGQSYDEFCKHVPRWF